jgi:deazaflavin-dependent oxidoreductase (nitroreductase family)
VRYSTLRRRRLTRYEQAMERFAASRAGGWAFLHVISPIDRRLLPLTRGRVSLAVGTPVGLLEARGARSGRRRRTPLLYRVDGDRLVVVASNVGSERHPAWLHNARAAGEVRFLSREQGWRTYRPRIAAGDERARLWRLATDLYAGYGTYQDRTGGREIPVVVLEPATREHQRGIEIPPAT